MNRTMNLKPRMSEKTYQLSKSENTFVFAVPVSANKMSVASAVEAQFDVKVDDVRIIVEKGKAKLSYRKRTRPVSGKRADQKKAYVRLAEGSHIPVFAAVEEEEKKAEEAVKKAKKESK